MTHGAVTLFSLLKYPDLMTVVFHQLPPCEESFRYLSLLACVCTCWQESARITRSDLTWLLPFRMRGIAYFDSLKNAKAQLDFDAHISGMVEYVSSQNMQESIVKVMFKQAEGSIEEKAALHMRFKTTDPVPLVSNLFKVFNRHRQSFSIFVATFQILGVLLLLDTQEDSGHRTYEIEMQHFDSLIAMGAVLHKDNMKMSQREGLVTLLSMQAVDNILQLRVCMDYLRSFPDSLNIVQQTLSVVVDYVDIGEEDFDTLMREDYVLSAIMQAATLHIANQFVAISSCRVLEYLMVKDNSMIANFVSADGVSLLVDIVRHHPTGAVLCVVFEVMKTIACDSAYVDLLHDSGILNFLLTNTAMLDVIIDDAAAVSQLMCVLLCCISHRHAFAHVLISHVLLPIIERTVARHPQDFSVYSDVVRLLVEMKTIVDLKVHSFTDELFETFGSNLIRFVHCPIMTEPVLDMLAILIENEQHVRWPLISSLYLTSVHQAMASHMDHAGLQRAGGNVVMLLTLKKGNSNKLVTSA